jgi:hypothetical protein
VTDPGWVGRFELLKQLKGKKQKEKEYHGKEEFFQADHFPRINDDLSP